MLEHITAKQLEKLKDDAMETLKTIDMKTVGKEKYLLIGASMAILAYENATDAPELPTTDYVPSSKVDEAFQEAIQHFVAYMKEKGLHQTTGAEVHKQYAMRSLRHMLDSHVKAMKMLYGAADAEEKKVIKVLFPSL